MYLLVCGSTSSKGQQMNRERSQSKYQMSAMTKNASARVVAAFGLVLKGFLDNRT